MYLTLSISATENFWQPKEIVINNYIKDTPSLWNPVWEVYLLFLAYYWTEIVSTRLHKYAWTSVKVSKDCCIGQNPRPVQ